MVEARLGFAALRRCDVPLLAGWLAEPLVARWWNHGVSPDAIERDFGPSIDGRDRTEVFLASVAGRRFGLIQRYPIGAYPQHAAALAAVCPVPAGALSIDYLIGEPDMRGRGLGAAMIAAFVERSWRAFPQAHHVLVPVSIGNRASWRALERAGFVRIARGELEPDNPRDSRDHFVYRRQRPG